MDEDERRAMAGLRVGNRSPIGRFDGRHRDRRILVHPCGKAMARIVIGLTICTPKGAAGAGTTTAVKECMKSTAGNEGMQVGFVDERYVLGELLGEGAMGQVFAARDVVLGIDVAVKMMHAELAKSRRHVTHFTSEAKIAARMLSPHVVKVLGLAVTRAGVPCIVYERLEGETLGQRIARDGGLSVADTVEIVKQTSRALARAHMIGVVHRDVKPDNIFLARDARGECLTGECPGSGELADIMALLRSGARPTFTERRPDLHGAVDAWIDRALHPDPYWRFASAKELCESLDSATRPIASTQASRITIREAA
jgi:hypothetical protein